MVWIQGLRPKPRLKPKPKTKRDPDSEFNSKHFGKKKQKKKKVYGTKNFETSKKFFFLFFLYFKFLNQKFFFLLIYIPKFIELNPESGSRWVLGLGLGPDPRPNVLWSPKLLRYYLFCMRIPS